MPWYKCLNRTCSNFDRKIDLPFDTCPECRRRLHPCPPPRWRRLRGRRLGVVIGAILLSVGLAASVRLLWEHSRQPPPPPKLETPPQPPPLPPPPKPETPPEPPPPPLPPPPKSETPPETFTMPRAANLRAGPSTSAPILGTIRIGEVVHVFWRYSTPPGDWLQIGGEEPRGWVWIPKGQRPPVHPQSNRKPS
jgi:Bacterial SH3 domain